jgi:lipopolysaccharide biosynthesis glycosyltransferase
MIKTLKKEKGVDKMSRPQVYIGYDSREEEAFDVLKYSLEKHSPNVDVHAIVQPDLRERKIYTRERDLTESTEFSITRFLTPYLSNYKGWSLFMDCDMLVTADITELFKLANPIYAVQVVKHYHQPPETTKMDGKRQTNYEKKNWSSVVLWNCGHRKNKNLTPEVINTVQPSFLHRFEWLNEVSDIGELPLSWNFLADFYKKLPEDVLPKNVHYTNGMPFMAGYENTDYNEIWYQYRDEMNS